MPVIQQVLNKFKPFLIALILIQQVINWPVPAAAQPVLPSNNDQVSNNQAAAISVRRQRLLAIDRTILLEYVKLARFNINFQTEANRHQPWRAWTYPIERESGVAAAFAGTLTDLAQRANGLNNPELVSQSALRNGLVSTLVGNLISGTGSSAQLAQNTWMMMQAAKQGYSVKDSLAFVKTSATLTRNLLAERHQLIDQEYQSKDRPVHEMESLLLENIREQLLIEFRQWSANSREIAFRENTFYAIDGLQSYLAATSTILSLNAFSNEPLAGPADICVLTANTLATLNPIIRTLAGICIRKHQRHKLLKDIPYVRPTATQELSSEEIQDLYADNPQLAKSFAEVRFLSAKAQLLDTAMDHDTLTINRLRYVAEQQAISGPLIGLASVARSTLITIAHYGYRSNKVVVDRLAFAGRISQAAGQAYALWDTPATKVKSILNNRHLSKQNKLPAQVMRERLGDLDALEKQINSSNPYQL